jgi:hypothetical protein
MLSVVDVVSPHPNSVTVTAGIVVAALVVWLGRK